MTTPSFTAETLSIPCCPSLLEAFNAAWTALANGNTVTPIASLQDIDFRPVSGGSINKTSLATLPDGSQIFVKQNRPDKLPLLTSEAVGLNAIAGAHARTCQPLAYGIDEDLACAFLLLSVINDKRAPDKAGWADLATQLATLHLAPPPQPNCHNQGQSHGTYQVGWFADNFIGSHLQVNGWHSDWHEFFATQRLGVQIKQAVDNGYLDKASTRQLERLQHTLPEHLPSFSITDEHGNPRPSLLHGDLWSGNAMIDQQGKGYLIDPAVYVGHPEADIAMTHMFGSFDAVFYEVYDEKIPIDSDFTHRQDIYNLYHYLNHLNLFGTGYLSAVKRIAQHFS